MFTRGKGRGLVESGVVYSLHIYCALIIGVMIGNLASGWNWPAWDLLLFFLLNDFPTSI